MELKTEKSETLSSRQIHSSALFLVHLHFEFCQFLPKSLLDRLPKPLLPRMRIHQNHHIVGESRVLDIRPLLGLSDLLCPFQHPVYFIKIDITEQRRNHSALWNTLLPRRLQHQLQEPQHLRIAHSPRHLLEHDMMFHRVEIRSPIEINHVGFARENRFRYALDGSVRGLLRPVAKRSGLKVGLKDRLKDQLQCSLDQPVSDRWNRQLANLAA